MMIWIDVFPSASILLDRSPSSWKINPDWSSGLWFRSPCNEIIVWYVWQFVTVFLKLPPCVLIERCLLWRYACSAASQEASQCWFSTLSQPAPHPVRGSHGTGRKACMRASALIQQVTRSVSSPCPIPFCPVLAWPGSGCCCTPEDDQVDFIRPPCARLN